jgi:hypothetical protein
MSSTTVFRDTQNAGLVPARGTYPAAANKMFPKGTIVQRDSSGRATPGAASNGLPAVGVSNASYNNLTGSEFGGGNDAINVEVLAGVWGFDYTGTPLPGETVWVADNQTVTDTVGTNGVAGVCVEVRDGQCYVWMGPHVASLFSDDSALESTVTTLGADVDALQADALTAQYVIPVPLGNFRVYASGIAVPAFSAGVADGFDPTAESIGIRFNDDTTAKLAASVVLPADLDDAAAIVVHVLGYRVGSLDTTAALTIGAFFREAGAAFSADSDAGGDTTTFAAATTVVSEETLSIASGDVPASPSSLLLTMVPNANLDDDDLVVLEMWLEVTRKLLAS